jgi:hypothetical protein
MVPTFRCDFRYLPAPATRSRRWLVGSADHCMQAADLETEAQAPVKVARTALPSQSDKWSVAVPGPALRRFV